MSTQNTNSMPLASKVIEHIRLSDAMITKAAAADAEHQAQRVKIANLIPKVCDALVTHERITPDQRAKVAEALSDPVRVLELMIKLAQHRNHAEVARLGESTGVVATEKTASALQSSSLTSPYVGAHTSGKIKESSARLFRGLGLTVPDTER